jgi:ABC-type phosphate/phosphonate transport system substrate-binding protein
MTSVLRASRYSALLCATLVLAAGCTQSRTHEQLSQESLGIGIVSGTLGEQQRVALCVRESSSISVVGQV